MCDVYVFYFLGFSVTCACLQRFDAVGWVAGRASGLQKTEWWGTGMVACLEQGANDLHGTADATATPSSLAPVKSRVVYLSGAGIPSLSWKKGR